MPKIPDCGFASASAKQRCILYTHNTHLVCAVHPEGVDTDSCLDFRPDPNAEIEEQWSPEGYSWYSDELIANRILDRLILFTEFLGQKSPNQANSNSREF